MARYRIETRFSVPIRVLAEIEAASPAAAATAWRSQIGWRDDAEVARIERIPVARVNDGLVILEVRHG